MDFDEAIRPGKTVVFPLITTCLEGTGALASDRSFRSSGPLQRLGLKPQILLEAPWSSGSLVKPGGFWAPRGNLACQLCHNVFVPSPMCSILGACRPTGQIPRSPPLCWKIRGVRNTGSRNSSQSEANQGITLDRTLGGLSNLCWALRCTLS